MKKTHIATVISFVSAAWVLSSAPALHAASSQEIAPSDPAYYSTHVAPLFQANCAKCHSGLNHRGGFSIDSRESLLKGGKTGAVIIPGHPEQSLLITLVHQVNLSEGQNPMPPKGKLSDSEIKTLEQWIRAGALIPASK